MLLPATACWNVHRTRRAQRKWNTRLQLRTSQPTDAPGSLHREQVRSLLSMRRSWTSSSETSGRPRVRSSPGSICATDQTATQMEPHRRRKINYSRATNNPRQGKCYQRWLHSFHSRLAHCSRAGIARERVVRRTRKDDLPTLRSCSPRSSYALALRKARTHPCHGWTACAFFG